jgi:hypothetical protein
MRTKQILVKRCKIVSSAPFWRTAELEGINRGKDEHNFVAMQRKSAPTSVEEWKLGTHIDAGINHNTQINGSEYIRNQSANANMAKEYPKKPIT